MSELGDLFGGMQRLTRERRKSNTKNSTEILVEKGVNFVSKNNGIHLIVENRFDFYPSTGLFMNRENGKRGRGVFNLIKFCDEKNK
tara:strand:- start:9817 stop:10074 length:258 start_codon:yes stop_codon:yes gene_type:complete